MSQSRPKALVTRASCAIGLLYADRLARRGYDLLLLAAGTDRPAALARILRAEVDVAVEIRCGDLSTDRSLTEIEARLDEDAGFDLVVNNLGLPPGRTLAEERPVDLDRLVAMNVKAYARISAAAASSMARREAGSIVNVRSAIGLAPEVGNGADGAARAFVMALTHTMQDELLGRGVYVQLVLAAATRTDIWPFPSCEPEGLPGMMAADDLVDAAFVGFDRREPVTIPSLANFGRWACYERARTELLSDLVNSEPALRYRPQE